MPDEPKKSAPKKGYGEKDLIGSTEGGDFHEWVKRASGQADDYDYGPDVDLSSKRTVEGIGVVNHKSCLIGSGREIHAPFMDIAFSDKDGRGFVAQSVHAQEVTVCGANAEVEGPDGESFVTDIGVIAFTIPQPQSSKGGKRLAVHREFRSSAEVRSYVKALEHVAEWLEERGR